MKNGTNLILAFAFVCLCVKLNAQVKNYSVKNAHSHNDYLRVNPFYLAFNNGFGSIEADIFPVDGILYVAHTKKEIKPKHTLQGLYLNPLLKAFHGSETRNLNLLIDIKENYKVSLPLLIKELEPLKQYLSTVEKPNYLTIIVSGDRPPSRDYKDYPGYIFFDGDLRSVYTDMEWSRVALISLPFNKVSGWKGKNDLNSNDRDALKAVIDSAHKAGKPIRFWAAPDTKASWEWQMKLQADLIGTDKVNELSSFLRKENNN